MRIVNRKPFLPFKEALLHARSLKLKGVRGWRTWRKNGERPANVPPTPDRTHKHDGWQGHGHWLGTGSVATKDQKFLPFKEAMLHARSLKLKGVKAWKERFLWPAQGPLVLLDAWQVAFSARCQQWHILAKLQISCLM